MSIQETYVDIFYDYEILIIYIKKYKHRAKFHLLLFCIMTKGYVMVSISGKI